MREKMPVFNPPGQVPSSPFADRVRDAVSVRCSELEELRPEALDLAASLVASLHEQLHGRATEYRGNRGAGYFRQQLRGEHPVTLEDISRLALDAPDTVVPALAILARHVGYTLAAIGPAPAADIHETVAGISECSGGVVAVTARAIADGQVDSTEAVEIEAEARQLEERLVGLRVALHQLRRHKGE